MKHFTRTPSGGVKTLYLWLTAFFLLTQTATAQSVGVWLTTPDQSQKLQQQSNAQFGPDGAANPVTISVDENTTYQTMDGFGAAVTGSAAYVINRSMSASQRDGLMNDLFTGSGIRLSFVRHTIGASDFNLQSYTYNDMPAGQTDPNLTNFSINYDRTDIIPVLKQARQKFGDLKLLGSPWSAPAWMKENQSLNGGWLNVAYYQAYANYLVKYVQAYQAEGLPIYAITLQNEPLHETAGYPSMRMDAGNQAAFLKNDLGPAFANAGLSGTKLIVYDHYWDRPDYPNEVLNDPAARVYAAGSAFHGYGGNPDQQTTTRNAHPDKGIWFTEISGGRWATDFGGNLRWNMSNIVIGTIRNWSKSVLFWNLALNPQDGPTNGGCTDCRAVVTVNSNGTYTREVEYYVLGHVSKFVDPGAVRIATNTYNGGIENVAFRNPDGSKVVIALNNGSGTQTFKVKWGTQAFSYTLAAGAAVTFKWSGAGSSSLIGNTIWLRGNNGRFVSSEDGAIPMMCNRTSVGGWEQFTVVDGGGGKIALQGTNGRYVSSEDGQSGMMCNRTAIGGWEAFDWIDLGGGRIALRGTNGRYVSSENGASAMMCNRTSIGGWEEFTWGTVDSGARMAEEEALGTSPGSFSAQLYPNPANGKVVHLYLQHLPDKQPAFIRIISLEGKTVYSAETFLRELRLDTSAQQIRPGMYQVQIISGSEKRMLKLVIPE